MKTIIDKSFQKDLAAIKNATLNKKVAACITNVSEAEQLSGIKNLKKLTGFETYYRIRIGDYRIGIEMSGNELIFIRILHRKEMYRFFP